MRQKKIHYIYNDAMECMDFDERKKLQGERLRATVELEYNNVPAYRKRMDEAGVKPEDINGIEDIVKLPFTFTIFANSAPEAPAAILAIVWKSTSSETLIFLACT